MNFLGYITASPKGRRKVPEEFGGYMAAVWGRAPLDRDCICAVGILRWIAYSEQTESSSSPWGSSQVWP